MAGYYDGGPENFKRWREAAQGVPKVTGFLYTTWQHRYEDLEATARQMRGEAPR
jgi:hypothetical protein